MQHERPTQRRLWWLGGLGILGIVAVLFSHNRPSSRNSIEGTEPIQQLGKKVAAIVRTEQKAIEHTWPDEVLAERFEAALDQLWDSVKSTSNKLQKLSSLRADLIIGPQLSSHQSITLGIEILRSSGIGETWDPSSWSSFIQTRISEGWSLSQLELRHVGFSSGPKGESPMSIYEGTVNLINSNRVERAMISGTIKIEWHPLPQDGSLPKARSVQCVDVSVKIRKGAPAFEEIWQQTLKPIDGSYFIDPLIARYSNSSKEPEIILAARNLVLSQQNWQFASHDLCDSDLGLIFTGLIADFDGDGQEDFLCAKFDGLYLFAGESNGKHSEPGRLVWRAQPHLKYGQTITCGDIDGDGDLDVFLGQYKVPYDRGQMPTPFYDARDGFPSYLFANDGRGNFTDISQNLGMGTKRWRRTYSASLVDLDRDGVLDLIVASDFAGLDVYRNDGHGRFQDVTEEVLPEHHSFGMAQIARDINADGKMDILMIGMNVPTADRLAKYSKTRTGFEKYSAMTAAMTYGNRLFLGSDSGKFLSSSLNDSIARTGWSWGCAGLDFDNDGFLDVYVTNGHETKATVKDYEREFWLHDIYVGTSQDDLVAFAYFKTKSAETRGKGISYGGNEHNRLFLNDRGRSFTEIGFLMGVSLEQDSRNVLAEDLDGDGRLDLIVTTFEAWPELKQQIRVFRNVLENQNNWIGFKLQSEKHIGSPVGATVTITYHGQTASHQIIAGDSYRSQGSWTAHFGLGSESEIEKAEIHWQDGQTITLSKPRLNSYHAVSRPK